MIQFEQVYTVQTRLKTEVGCLHQHTVKVLYRLDKNGKLLEIFSYPSNNRVF